MEQTHSENLQLVRLVADALGEIERLDYSRRSRSRYRATWEHLIEFSDRNELRDEFSGDLVVHFLEECRVGDEEMERPAQGWRKHIVWGVKVLADFAEHGRIERAFADVDDGRLAPGSFVLHEPLQTDSTVARLNKVFPVFKESADTGPNSGA